MRHVPGVSLQRKLLLWLLLPQLVLWLSGGFLAWRIALQNGEKGIDQTLTQSVRALARQIKPIGDGLLVDFPKAAQDILEQDPADRITYMVSSPPGRFLLGNAQLPPPPPVEVRVGDPYLYHARVDDRPVRVALLDVDYGTPQTRQTLRVQVAQSLTVRERIAQELLEQMVFPMGLMGLALSAVVYAGVLRGLQPLKRLEAQIERAGALPQAGTTPLPPHRADLGSAGGAFAGQHHQPAAGDRGARPAKGKALSQRRCAPTAHPAGRAHRPDRAGPARKP